MITFSEIIHLMNIGGLHFLHVDFLYFYICVQVSDVNPSGWEEQVRQFPCNDGQFTLTVPQWKLWSQLPLLPTPPPCLPRSPSHFIPLSLRRSSLASPSSTPLCTLDSSWWCTSSSGCCTSTNTKDGAIRVSSCSSVCSGLPSALFCSPFTSVTLWKPTNYLLHCTGCSTASLCVCSSSLSALLTCILLR